MGKKQEGDIYRKYYNRKRGLDISWGTRDIHDKLSISHKLSQYGQEDANRLTKFFTAYKQAESQAESISKTITFTFLKEDITVPWIDYSIGGQGDEGKAFEAQLQQLFDNSFDVSTGADVSIGALTAYSKIDIGKDIDASKVKEILKGDLLDELGNICEDLDSSVEKHLVKEVDQEGYMHTYLKTAVSRAAKIDNAAVKTISTSSGLALHPTIINISATTSPGMERIKECLQNGKFSTKSYKLHNTVHLGDTDDVKAISAIANWAGTMKAKATAIFFLHHPSSSGLNKEDPQAITNLYGHYVHMKKVYELTGTGLTYRDAGAQTLGNVDFLIVNRYDSADKIKVESVNEKIKEYLRTPNVY